MGLCLSVCLSVYLSVTSRCSTKTAERIELVFGVWASFHPFYTVLKGNSVISKYKGTSLSNFVLNTGLRKFRHGISTVETCYQLSSRKVDAHSVINWAVVGLFMTPIKQWKRLARVTVECTCLFTTHWPTLTLQLHNFDLFRTCRTSSFCAVARQLARFQLTRRIARSLGDS